jgi:hypothetical protein
VKWKIFQGPGRRNETTRSTSSLGRSSKQAEVVCGAADRSDIGWSVDRETWDVMEGAPGGRNVALVVSASPSARKIKIVGDCKCALQLALFR